MKNNKYDKTTNPIEKQQTKQQIQLKNNKQNNK